MNIKQLLFILLFSISMILNVYLLVSQLIKNTYTPSDADADVLAELTTKVLKHDAYKQIDDRELIYAIKPSVNRFNVTDTTSLYHYEIYVKTNLTTHIFSCVDEQCQNVELIGTTYSQYSDEPPILPNSD